MLGIAYRAQLLQPHEGPLHAPALPAEKGGWPVTKERPPDQTNILHIEEVRGEEAKRYEDSLARKRVLRRSWKEKNDVLFSEKKTVALC